MSILSERLMRGEYISIAESFENWEDITRTMDAYPRAMAAMEEHERKMAACICNWDIDWNGNGVRQASPACPVDHEGE